MMRPCMLLVLCGVLVDAANFHRLLPAVTEASVEEAALKWLNIEKSLQDGIESLIKQMLPTILRSGSEVEIDPACMGDMLRIVNGLRELKLWAIHILDAIGKPGGGQSMGTPSAYGDYQECIDVVFPPSRSEKLTTGQYCILEVRLPIPPKPKVVFIRQDLFKGSNVTFKTEAINELKEAAFGMYVGGLRLGLCVPSTCSKQDLGNIINAATKDYNVIGLIYSCEIKHPLNIDTVQLSILGACFGLLLLCGLCTTVHAVWSMRSEDKKPRGLLVELVSCFSCYRHIKSVLNIGASEDQPLEALNGMRVASLFWIIMCHSFSASIDPTLYRSALRIESIALKNILYQVVLNGYGSVHTFFVITSVLIAYNLLKLSDVKGKRIFNAPIMIIRRIWRLLPSEMFVIGLILLLPLVGSGPLHDDTLSFWTENCRNYWWRNVAFIQNFYEPTDLCLGHSWYLACDGQYFLMAIIYFFLYFKKPSLGWIFLIVTGLASITYSAVIVYVKHFPPTVLLTLADTELLVEYGTKFYFSSFVNWVIYAIGLGLGTYMAKAKKCTLTRGQVAIGWTLATIGALTNVYIVYIWNSNYERPSKLDSVLYSIFHRPGWAVCIGWVIYACANGRGGIVNELLSWNGFKPFVRLSYMMYLVHFPVIMIFSSNLQGPMDMSHYTLVLLFLGNLVGSTIVAIFCRIFFEGPMVALDSIFFPRNLKPDRNEENGKVASQENTAQT